MRLHIHDEWCLAHQIVRQGRSCTVDASRTPANVHHHTTTEKLAAQVAGQRTRSIPRTGPDDPAHITVLSLDPREQAFVRCAEHAQEVC